MTGRIGEALKRKLGPLPAWAWLAVVGVAVVLYRRYRQQQDGIERVPAFTSPDVTGGNAGMLEGHVLGPGEAYYDPNTGKLVTNPETPPGAPPPEASENPPPDTGSAPQPAAPGEGAGGKRRNKPKVNLGIFKGARGPHHAKVRIPRAHALHKPGSGARGRSKPHPKRAPGAPKPRPAPKPKAKPGRGRSSMPRATALRQRTAPARVVDHVSQQAVKLPAGPVPAHISLPAVHVPVSIPHTAVAKAAKAAKPKRKKK